MKRTITTIIFILSGIFLTTAQDHAFKLFDANGNQITFNTLVEAAIQNDIILFGEFHDQPICHWLQKKVLQSLINDSNKDLLLGLEMIETDNQIIIDEYEAGIITQKKFEEESRMWKNYKTDYKPTVDLAKENGVKIVGTNVPGRYANAVYNQGIDILNKISDTGKEFLPPLPIYVDFELPGYASLKKMAGDHGGDNFVNAQALRDATMAHNILRYMSKGNLFLHLNGSYHSDNYEGIFYYLKQSSQDYKIITISTVYQSDINSLLSENINKADVIICIPESMNRSY